MYHVSSGFTTHNYFIVVYYHKCMNMLNAHNMCVNNFIDTYIYKYKIYICTEKRG